MLELTKLKNDRDTCYYIAATVLNPVLLNNLLWEGNDIDEHTLRRIDEAKAIIHALTSRKSILTDGLWHEPDYEGRTISSDNL